MLQDFVKANDYILRGESSPRFTLEAQRSLFEHSCSSNMKFDDWVPLRRMAWDYYEKFRTSDAQIFRELEKFCDEHFEMQFYKYDAAMRWTMDVRNRLSLLLKSIREYKWRSHARVVKASRFLDTVPYSLPYESNFGSMCRKGEDKLPLREPGSLEVKVDRSAAVNLASDLAVFKAQYFGSSGSPAPMVSNTDTASNVQRHASGDSKHHSGNANLSVQHRRGPPADPAGQQVISSSATVSAVISSAPKGLTAEEALTATQASRSSAKSVSQGVGSPTDARHVSRFAGSVGDSSHAVPPMDPLELFFQKHPDVYGPSFSWSKASALELHGILSAVHPKSEVGRTKLYRKSRRLYRNTIRTSIWH